MQNTPISRIVIVGGGTAGWSAAACLQRFLANRDVTITLVEAPQIGTVGVGEASIPNIRNFNAYVGLDEIDFLKSTGGTFKLGIRFDDWRELGHSFFHPFGPYGIDLDGLDFHQCFYAAQIAGLEADLEEFSLPSILAGQSRFAQPSSKSDAVLSQYGYAFHFDAGRYAVRLREIAVERGVKHVKGLVSDAKLHPSNGFIEHVTLDTGESLAADLFVDCSGFRALLIEQQLQTGYEDWSEWLPCDRAVALPSAPCDGSLPSFTTATAREAGWTWSIPLQHRTGNGYVYASAFLDPDLAVETLRNVVSGSAESEPNHQRFTAGMRKQFWNRNCVSLGLASGFLEPLESTSINLVHRGLSVLMDHFPGKACDPRLTNTANAIFTGEQERIRDFLILHYKLSQRSESPFWRHIRDMPMPDSLNAKLDAWEANGSIIQGQFESFKPESWLTMYEGFGLRPETLDTRLADLPSGSLRNALDDMRSNILQASRQALSHREFVDRFCPAAQPEIL